MNMRKNINKNINIKINSKIPALHLCRLGEVWEESEEGRLSYPWYLLASLQLLDLYVKKKATRFVTVLHILQKIADHFI